MGSARPRPPARPRRPGPRSYRARLQRHRPPAGAPRSPGRGPRPPPSSASRHGEESEIDMFQHGRVPSGDRPAAIPSPELASGSAAVCTTDCSVIRSSASGPGQRIRSIPRSVAFLAANVRPPGGSARRPGSHRRPRRRGRGARPRSSPSHGPDTVSEGARPGQPGSWSSALYVSGEADRRAPGAAVRSSARSGIIATSPGAGRSSRYRPGSRGFLAEARSTIANRTAITRGPRSTPGHMLQPAVPSSGAPADGLLGPSSWAGLPGSPERHLRVRRRATRDPGAPDRHGPEECMRSRTSIFVSRASDWLGSRRSSPDYALIGAGYADLSASHRGEQS